MDNVSKLHCLPKDMISDRGSIFALEIWNEMTQPIEIDRRLSMAFHTQTDGQTKRTHGILEPYLKGYNNHQQDDYTELLATTEFEYNYSHQETINVSPFYANY